MTDFEGAPLAEPSPVQRLPDALPSRNTIESPVDAYLHSVNDFFDRTDRLSRRPDASEELAEDTAQALAMRDFLAQPFINTDDRYFITDQRNWKRACEGHFSTQVAAAGLTMENLQERANTISPAANYEYHLAKLESYTTYLRDGTPPTNWPDAEDNLRSHRIANQVADTAQTLSLVATTRPEAFDTPEQAAAMRERYNIWAADTCGLLLHHRRFGMSLPLLNTLEGARAAAALDQLCMAMEEVSASEDDSEYRKLFGSIVRSLAPRYLETFLAVVPQHEAPLTPGATRTITESNGLILTERYAEQQEYTALLADGSPVQLPYVTYYSRSIFDYRQPTEHEILATQTSVPFEELDEVALHALSVAVKAASQQRLREETLPYYQRLVLKPGSDGTDLLHALHFRPDVHRRMHEYPDDHGMVTSETEPQVEPQRIRALGYVSSNWLVVPNRGDYVQMTTYLDPEPNFFGPGEDKANAFWIAGNPRLIYDAARRPQLMQRGKYATRRETPRWAIVPVNYYWADKAPLTPANPT
jgi:hypothetical protein